MGRYPHLIPRAAGKWVVLLAAATVVGAAAGVALPRARAAAGAPAVALVVREQTCSARQPGDVAVAFQWQPAQAGWQWLDVSMIDGGFDPGTFASVGPLPAGTSSYSWDALLPGQTYYVRVNTLGPGGWEPSETLEFVTGVCPPPPPPPPIVVSQQQFCSATPGKITVSFQWTPSGRGPQWLDLSLSDNGFAAGTFATAGPLAATAGSFIWDGLLPGRTHFLRVNTLGPSGWEPSETLAFTTGVCPAAPKPPQPDITYQETCSATPGKIRLTFQWKPSRKGQQWLDLSLFNRFSPGTFASVGPLSPDVSSYTWDAVSPGMNHFVRINTLTPAGWEPLQTLSLTTGICSGSATPTPPKKVVLTFDDYGNMGGILDILSRYGARAIFFPIGTWAAGVPDLVQRAINEGHLVCNHTFSHANLTALSADAVQDEIRGGAVGNCDLLRPPYALHNPFVDAIAAQMGFRIFFWNIDSRDFLHRGPGGDQEILDAVLSRVFPGAVVLLHMHVANTVAALPTLIERLQAMGYVVSY